MTPGLPEYVVLRFVRRFLVSDRMLKRLGGVIPYYRTNVNEVDARPVVEMYERFLGEESRALPAERTVLEIGSGATNSVGYALAQSALVGPRGRVVLFEPFAPLDEKIDQRQRAALPPGVAERVQRISSLDSLQSGSVDLVLSHSVLEHVRDPASTIAQLARVLSARGVMLHAVDYRDHFFKYPFHFLLFSRRAWDRWLDPGDLPRWRLSDHVRQLRAGGFSVRVIEAKTLPKDFAKVSPRIHPDFDREDPDVAVTQATLLATRLS